MSFVVYHEPASQSYGLSDSETSTLALDAFLTQPVPPLQDHAVINSTDDREQRLRSLQHQLALTRIAIQRIAMIVVVVFGVVGNAVNIAVLTRRWMKSSTNFYLTALAICDALYLIFAFTMTWIHYDGIQTASWYIRYRDPYGRPLTDMCSNTGVWLTLTFTVERYIGVCYPMKGKVWCTPKRAKYVIIAVCFIAGVLTFPEFFEFSVEDITINNVTVTRRNATEFSRRPSYQFGYVNANQVLFTFLPLLLLLIFNSLLIRAVMQSTKLRKAMTNKPTTNKPVTNKSTINMQTTKCNSEPGYSGENVIGSGGKKFCASYQRSEGGLLVDGEGRGVGGEREIRNREKSPGAIDGARIATKGDRHQNDQQRITIMLIGVVIVFLVCQLPQAIQKLYHVYVISAMPDDHELLTKLKITGNYFNLLVTINCSTNFVLYSSFSTKFRATFRRLFCARCRCCPDSVRRRLLASSDGCDPLLSTGDLTTCQPTTAAATAHRMYVLNDGHSRVVPGRTSDGHNTSSYDAVGDRGDSDGVSGLCYDVIGDNDVCVREEARGCRAVVVLSSHAVINCTHGDAVLVT